jgi:hypothetical protein
MMRSAFLFLAMVLIDNFATGFTAKNPQGRQVFGTVCCGIMKACTIRF